MSDFMHSEQTNFVFQSSRQISIFDNDFVQQIILFNSLII